MRNIIISSALVSVATLMAADAQSFGINFRNGANFTVNTASGLTYSGVPASQWHNTSGSAGAYNETVTAPAAAGVKVSYASSNTWGTNVSNDIGDGYLDDTGGGLMVTITGLSSFLPAGQQYRVRALQSSDNATGFVPTTVYQGTNTAGAVLSTLTNPVTSGGGALFGETIYSTGLTADAITLKPAARAGTQRATLAGVVIEVVPPPADHFTNAGTTSFATAPLGNGQTSSFRIGSRGTDSVSVTQAGGLSVGTAAGQTHRIDINANGLITPGTYTLIDYDGAIGGAGFAGLVLGSTPHMQAQLVDNAAESKIQLEVISVDGLQWTGSASTAWDQSAANWYLFSDSSAVPFFQGDEIYFDDSATRGQVLINGEVRPSSMLFTNELLAYQISGGAIAGETGLDMLGAGTLTLGSANTFTGAIKVSSGTLVSAADAALGDKGGLELSGSATLKTTVNQTIDRPLAVASGGGTIEVAGSITAIHKGAIQSQDALTKTGQGTLALESYSGSTANAATDLVVDEGTVEMRGSFFNGYPFGAENFSATINDNGLLRLTAAHALGGDYYDYATSLDRITVNDHGVLHLDAAQYLRKGVGADGKGRIVLQGATLRGAGALLGVGYDSPANDKGAYSTISVLADANPSSISNSGGIDTGYRSVKIDVEDGAAALDLVMSAPVIGNNGLIKTGPGTMAFSGSATNKGTNQILEGTFALRDLGSLGQDSTLDLAGSATLRLDYSGSKSVKDLKFDGASQASGTWGAPGSGAQHESARIAGTGLLQAGTADPFAQWLSTSYPQLSGADAQAAADPDKDGLSNREEFALDGNPSSGTATGKLRSRVESVGSEQALVITLPVRNGASFTGTTALSATVDGVTYTIAGSNNLSAWDQAVTEITTSSTGMPALSTGWSYRSFRLSGALPARGARGFLRASVQ